MKRMAVVFVALVGGLIGAVAHADDVTLASVAPVVVKTVPEAGTAEVDPKLTEIKVTFSKDKLDGWGSGATLSKESFPNFDGKPKYPGDKGTRVVAVKVGA